MWNKIKVIGRNKGEFDAFKGKTLWDFVQTVDMSVKASLDFIPVKHVDYLSTDKILKYGRKVEKYYPLAHIVH